VNTKFQEYYFQGMQARNSKICPPSSISKLKRMNIYQLAIATIVFRILFNRSSKIRYFSRMAMLAAAIALSGLGGIFSALILAPLSKGAYVNSVTAYVMRVCCPLFTGMHYEIVSGDQYLDFEKPRVYICNHQALLDMLVIGAVLPNRCVVMAKQEIKLVPIMGQVLWAGKNMFIHRQDRSKAIDAMNSVADRMVKERLSVWVFPEGTRTHQMDNSLRHFKKGAFHLAKKHGFEIVPIVVSTFYPVYSEKTKIFERGTIQIKGN
jgi:lysophosphatidate acyltransferase